MKDLVKNKHHKISWISKSNSKYNLYTIHHICLCTLDKVGFQFIYVKIQYKKYGYKKLGFTLI
jgi:hypothetical protein